MENKTTIAGVEMSAAIAQKLTNFNISNLDLYEKMAFNDLKNNGKEFAIQVLINQVEGNYSQLSPALAEIAEEQDNQTN